MLLFPLTAFLAVSLAYVRGGSLRRLAHVELRTPELLAVALALQVALRVVSPAWQPALLWCSYGLVGIWFVRNARCTKGLRTGMGLLALGYVMNLAVMAPNGGMPVSDGALRDVGGASDPDRSPVNIAKHVPGDDGLPSLFGDVIPVPSLGAVVSPGDVVMLAGTAVTITAGMGDSARRRALGAISRSVPA